MSNELKIGKIITFSGKRVEWPLWSEKFKARANRKGYKGILVGHEDYIVPTDDEDVNAEPDTDKKKWKQELRRLNEEAYASQGNLEALEVSLKKDMFLGGFEPSDKDLQ